MQEMQDKVSTGQSLKVPGSQKPPAGQRGCLLRGFRVTPESPRSDRENKDCRAALAQHCAATEPV